MTSSNAEDLSIAGVHIDAVIIEEVDVEMKIAPGILKNNQKRHKNHNNNSKIKTILLKYDNITLRRTYIAVC